MAEIPPPGLYVCHHPLPPSSPPLPCPLDAPSARALLQQHSASLAPLLPPNDLASLLAWMSMRPPQEVHGACTSVLEELRCEAQSRERPTTLHRVQDTLWGLFNPTTAAALGRVEATDYPDVRLSHHALEFGPEHRVGDRVPPLGSASVRPPPPPPGSTPPVILPPHQPPPQVVPPSHTHLHPGAVALTTRHLSEPPPPLLQQQQQQQQQQGGSHHAHPPPLPPPSPPICPINTPLSLAITVTNHGRKTVTVQFSVVGVGGGGGGEGGVVAATAGQGLLGGGIGRVTLLPYSSSSSKGGEVGGLSAPAATVAAARAVGEGGSVPPYCPPMTLKRGETSTLIVTLTLFRPSFSVGALVMGEVWVGTGGGSPSPPTSAAAAAAATGSPPAPRLMAVLRATSSTGVFGVPLGDAPLAPPGSVGAGGWVGVVPLPLALLRERLIGGGGEEEGVFRVTPSSTEREALRKVLDEGGALQFVPPTQQQGQAGAAVVGSGVSTFPCTGVGAAHMVKLYLRELPAPLLAGIPMEALMGGGGGGGGGGGEGPGGGDTFLPLLKLLGARERGVLVWLADLLVETAGWESGNKMSARNLAICVGPNLYAAEGSLNPMEALMTSQKAVGLLLALINARKAGRKDFA